MKLLVDPILLLIPVLIFLIARSRRWAAAIVAVVLILSMPITSIGLERTLLRPSADDRTPEVIDVVSGGLYGPSFERAAAAADWWREHRNARLIIGGADTLSGGRTSIRILELMRELAIGRGVDPAAITLETRSRNTWEHPTALLLIPGITPGTRVGVVTSPWHMRRAAWSFRRVFHDVIEHPAQPSSFVFTPAALLPSSGALSTSTVMIREWVGIVWYAVRR